MIYVLIPLYLSYRFASAPVENDATETIHTAEMEVAITGMRKRASHW